MREREGEGRMSQDNMGFKIFYMGLAFILLGVLLSILALVKGFFLPSLLGIMMVFAGFYALYVGLDIIRINSKLFVKEVQKE